jgi:hypothetical protein
MIRARICKPFREPRNRFPARRNRFLGFINVSNQNETLLWKIAVLGMKNPPVGAGTFKPSPILLFYILPCRKCQRSAYCFIFCAFINIRKIPEMSSGMEECKIPA